MTNKFWTISLFGIVFSTFLLLGYILYQDIDDTSDKRAWEVHTADVQSKIRDIVELNYEQGVEFRSYFLSKEVNYKQRYKKVTKQATDAISDLYSLANDNESQAKSAKEISSLFNEKNDLHNQVFTAIDQNSMYEDTMLSLLSSCDSLTSKIKWTSKMMISEENVLLRRRKEEFDEQVMESKRSALYLTSALLLVLILALLFILKSFTAMRKSRKIVEKQNLDLVAIRSNLELRNVELNLLSEKFESSMFHSKVAAFDWSDTSKDSFWISKSMFTMLDLDDEDFNSSVSDFFGKLMHPEDAVLVQENLTNHLQNGSPYNPEYRLKKKNGLYSYFRAIGDTSLKNGLQRMTGVIINIDKEIELREIREKMNAKLEEYSLRFDLVLKGSEYGVWDWFDISDSTQWWSQSFYDLIGFDAEDYASTTENFQALVYPEDRSVTQAAIEDCIQNGIKINIEYRLLTKDHGYTWFRAVGDRILDENNPSKIRMIGVVSDISQEKLFSEELKRSNADLQDFAYVASHDLQEPLRKIQAFGDRLKMLCEKEGDDFVGLPMVEKMNESATRMRGLIDDLLNYSRVSAESNFVDDVNLNELIVEVKDLLSDVVESKNAEFIIQEDLPVLHEVNQGNMFQLFQNLISNALKFHKKGEIPRIEITSKVIDANEINEIVPSYNTYKQYHRIEVKDNGIGFDEQYLGKIFTIFQRLNGRSEYKGTGIGLAVCQKLCENHGGMIGAHSEVGKGATFYVILPVK